jgi:SNF2 family DNA or RNA helicase
MTKKLLEMYDTVAQPLSSLSLSFKMQILMQILELAEATGDKTLVFSHSILTLDYIESMLKNENKTFIRVDGETKTMDRQALTKVFNELNDAKVCLISTKAGGIGLNMAGANRVVILDTHFSPMHEEQAIGRAYRLGQTKTVYVYRLMLGGTFEEAMFNQSLFKQQLATRVVDKKNPVRNAQKSVKQYVFRPRPSGRKDLSSHIGEDPGVLDRLIVEGKRCVGLPFIHSALLIEL